MPKEILLGQFILLLFLFPSSSMTPPWTFGTASPSSSWEAFSLGGTRLRQLVTESSRRDADCLDLQGIAWLEHINLIVGGPRSLAEIFYLDVLGCTPDASKSFHVNLGQQQFHLAVAKEDERPQCFAGGSIGLAVPDLNSLRNRIQQHTEALSGTQFQLLQDHEDCVTLRGPWGNIFHLYSTAYISSSQSSSSMKMVNAHTEAGMYGSQRMAIRDQPGIRYIEIPCPKGQGASLAFFYRHIMKCSVHILEETAEAIIVSVGPGVHLVFVEREDAPSLLEFSKGIHICIYYMEFEGLYHRLKNQDLIWTNPRFLHLDSCDTWEEAAASRTLRFKSLINMESHQEILELEHETRPLRHGQYLKVPNYEPK